MRQNEIIVIRDLTFSLAMTPAAIRRDADRKHNPNKREVDGKQDNLTPVRLRNELVVSDCQLQSARCI